MADPVTAARGVAAAGVGAEGSGPDAAGLCARTSGGGHRQAMSETKKMTGRERTRMKNRFLDGSDTEDK